MITDTEHHAGRAVAEDDCAAYWQSLNLVPGTTELQRHQCAKKKFHEPPHLCRGCDREKW